jgi:hypothetical protein
MLVVGDAGLGEVEDAKAGERQGRIARGAHPTIVNAGF